MPDYEKLYHILKPRMAAAAALLTAALEECGECLAQEDEWKDSAETETKTKV